MVQTKAEKPDLESLQKSEYLKMKNEVAFLKKVLRLKNSGEGGITELVYKIKELENENQRLKAAKKDRIQNLILEN